jgi:mannose-6-phosphate isomerase
VQERVEPFLLVQPGEREEQRRLVRDAIETDPAYWLGTEHVDRFGTSPGLLVKLLDSAERLPVHAHPSRAFARAHLGSPFGKTEAWIVLATRDDHADVWVGLREPVERDVYRGWIERQETAELLASLNRVRVAAGDVVYVAGGELHCFEALGAEPLGFICVAPPA